jgi:hypothetical protein
MEENCPRKLRTEEILKKCIKWKGEDTQRTKAKLEGKNQRKKVVQQETFGPYINYYNWKGERNTMQNYYGQLLKRKKEAD